MKQVFITGASGFIGSHLVNNLVKKKFKIVALSSKQLDLPNVEVLQGDVFSSIDLSSYSNFDAVFHLASITNVKYFNENLEYCRKVNVDGTRNVVNAVRDKTGKFVYTSTFGVYGNPDSLPVKENAYPKPTDPYSLSKLDSEKIVSTLCNDYGIGFSIGRIFSCYGDRQKDFALVPVILKQIISSDKFVVSNKNMTRDFIHVSDVVSALDLLSESKVNGVYNIGSGEETLITDITLMLSEFLHKRIRILEDSSKFRNTSVEVLRACADISGMKKLGWMPKVLLRDGLKNLVVNYKNKNVD